MRNLLLTLCGILLLTSATLAQHCAAPTTSIAPRPATGTPGFTPSPDNLPCADSGYAVSDTIYFENYSSFLVGPSTVTVNSVKIDSIKNLPPGLCWVTNVANNTFASGQTGVIYISGNCTAPRGQYKLRIIIDLKAGPGNAITYNSADLEQISGTLSGRSQRYYMRVKCAYGSCPAIDSANGVTHYFIADSSACYGTLNATVQTSGPTTICSGDVVTLSNINIPGTTYLWSTGATTSSITVGTTGAYTLTAYNGTDSMVSSPVTVTVNNPASGYAITPGGPTTLCAGSNVHLDAGAGYTSYHWSTGASTEIITVTSTNTYRVTALGTDGCRYHDSVAVTVNPVPSVQTICVVGVDSSSGKNIVIWEKTGGTIIDSFRVYRESSIAGVYDYLSGQPYSSFSTYIDAGSNPAQQSGKYEITAINVCGVSAFSAPHQTIHLTSNLGVGGVINLIWNAYIGFTYPSYDIYRGTSPGNMQLLTTVSSSTLSYTDLTPPAGNVYYQIGVANPSGCHPSKTYGYASSLSNVINVVSTGLEQIDALNLNIYYYYDADHSRALHFSPTVSAPVDIKLYDLSGREIMGQKDFTGSQMTLLPDISAGTYIVSIKDQNKVLTKKIAITQ